MRPIVQSSGAAGQPASKNKPTTTVEPTVTPIQPTMNQRRDGELICTMTEEIIARYEGFWHSEPDFSDGILEFYVFTWCEYFGGYYMDTNGGESYALGATQCIMEDDILYLDSWITEYPTYTIEYIAQDPDTNDSALIINDQKFWKLDMPQE